MKYEENVKTIMEDKFKEINDQSKYIITENIELKSQLSMYTKRFEEISKTISQYNDCYETLKKENEKIKIENVLLNKESGDLKVSISKQGSIVDNFKVEIGKKDRQITVMANLNRNLQEQLKNLKKTLIQKQTQKRYQQ